MYICRRQILENSASGKLRIWRPKEVLYRYGVYPLWNIPKNDFFVIETFPNNSMIND
jgi:hypothetical protein